MSDDRGDESSDEERTEEDAPDDAASSEEWTRVDDESAVLSEGSGSSDSSLEVEPVPSAEESDAAYCRACGEKLRSDATVCPNCGVERPMASAKDPALAAVLSLLLPGAGQVYNGQPMRGLLAFCGVLFGDIAALVVGFVVVSVLTLVTLGLGAVSVVPYVLAFFLVHAFLALLVVYDAYDQAQRITEGRAGRGR